MDTHSSSNKGEGHRSRIREKYSRGGVDGFLDYELLELLLTYAIPRQDVRPLAKSLIEQYKTLAGVVDAKPEELGKHPGIGPNSVILIRLIRDLAVYYLKQKLEGVSFMTNVEDFANFARMKLGNSCEEVMMVFYLNVKNMLIQTEIVSQGTLDQVPIFPGEVARHAIECHARNVAICHNHPSGFTDPSGCDNAVTIELRRALDTVGIRLLDHIIVSKFNYYSYRCADELRGPRNKILEAPPPANLAEEE